MPEEVEVEPQAQATTFQPIMWVPREETVFCSTSEGLTTPQLLEVVAPATREQEPVVTMAEEQEAGQVQDPMVVHGAAVVVVVDSTMGLEFRDTRVGTANEELFWLDTQSPQLL
jgi:hypothetical protein